MNTATGCHSTLIEIFNNSQHVTSADSALNQLKKLHKNTEYSHFKSPFKDLFKKLLQSKHTTYFKTSCECICKFLEHVAKLADETKGKDSDDPHTTENTVPSAGLRRRAKGAMQAHTSRPNPSPKTRKTKRGAKRKAADVSDDELVMDFAPKRAATVAQTDSTDEDSIIESTILSKRTSTASSIATVVGAITNHDRLITLCMDVVDHYMQVANEDCRLNAVFFVHQFLPHIKNLDEGICNALRITLPQRIRDRKPIVRAHAVYASRTFQESKLTRDAFIHHFYRDPELVVRKALLQIMDTKIFGYQFLVESTQDTHETMRKDAFRRLGKLSPLELNKVQLHQVLHNGLSEHERLASYFFRNNTLDPWLAALYDGSDLYRLLLCFDTLNHHQDICRLLRLIFERNLEKLENNGTTTKLHLVVEVFREKWLQSDKNCLPKLEKLDINLVTIWLSLIDYCKKNRTLIRNIKVREIESNTKDDSIEKILDSQSREDDLVELYERLTPDLVNLVDFIQKYVIYVDKTLKSTSCDPDEFEFIYNLLMELICSYEIGDELERKTIQDVLGSLIRENLLTGKFSNFIPPIIKCLSSLIYSNNHSQLIDYVSEIINNVRSHLEDILTSTRATVAPGNQTVIHVPSSQKKNPMAPDLDCDNLEIKIADLRVKIEEFKDQLDIHIKDKDFDRAKEADRMITKLKDELALLHSRRCSIASDISHMSMVVEKEPTDQGKLCSTMLDGDVSMNDSDLSSDDKDDTKVFKHHPNELIKCLQMYYGCLQNVNISAIPLTMLNHLNHLSYECLDEWYRENCRVRSLMVACNGLTALVDREYAEQPTTMTLLVSACHDRDLETRTTGFKSVVDVLCRHDEIKYEEDKVIGFLKMTLRDYGKLNPFEMKKNEFEFQTAVIEGTTKLFYHRILSSPEVLSHLILWWYHPRTHSKLKQFIGIFLPAFVEDIRKTIDPDTTGNIEWLKDLLEATFVISIEYLHAYILGQGHAIMSATDLLSLINFLSNLIPASFHRGILVRVDERIDEVKNRNPDLAKYLKQSKNSLTPVIKSVSTPRPVLTPIPTPNQALSPTLESSPVLERSSIMNE